MQGTHLWQAQKTADAGDYEPISIYNHVSASERNKTSILLWALHLGSPDAPDSSASAGTHSTLALSRWGGLGNCSAVSVISGLQAA